MPFESSSQIQYTDQYWQHNNSCQQYTQNNAYFDVHHQQQIQFPEKISFPQPQNNIAPAAENLTINRNSRKQPVADQNVILPSENDINAANREGLAYVCRIK